MHSHDILVRGAGAVGLAAALALSRQGLRVALLGSLAEPQHEDLRAYALNPASVELLRSLKVWDAIAPEARTAVHEMHVEGDAPGAAIDFSAWSQAVPELAWIVEAGELERALRAAVRFAPHVQGVEHEVPAALQVLAEGRDSATRARLGVQMPRQAYGQHAIAARLASDRPHAGLARQWFRCPDVLALLPLSRPVNGAGAAPGEPANIAAPGEPARTLALVWSLPDAHAQSLMAASDAEFTAALNDATGAQAGTLVLTGARAMWPLAVGRAEPSFGPGWVLVGDAAHVVHPLAGQGLNLGLEDVVSLAETLAGREAWRSLGDPRLLARHARRRAAPTLAMAQVTDGLLQLFASPSPWVKELRNRGLTLANQLPPLKRLLTRRALGG